MNTTSAPTATALLDALGVQTQADLATASGHQLAAVLAPLLDDDTAPLAASVHAAEDGTAELLRLTIEVAVAYRRAWLSGPASRLDAAFTRDQRLLAAL